MLEIEGGFLKYNKLDSKRISWDELFDHELLKTKMGT